MEFNKHLRNRILRNLTIIQFRERTSCFLSVERSNAIRFLRHRGSSSCAFQPTCLHHFRQLCSFLQYEKQLFRVSSLRERKNAGQRMVAEGWTEIINARLPTTPYYSGPLPFDATASRFLRTIKNKRRTFYARNFICAINISVLWSINFARLYLSFY